MPPDFDFYVKNSKALIQILNDYTPDVEQYSIDEAFLDMTGTEALFGPPLTAAHTIRRRVRRELGFTVNVGIAPNRLLAKMASDFEKPDRVHTLYKYEVETKMWPLSVGDLFGVGPSAAKRLNSCGIYTIGDLARLERDTAVKLFGSRGDTLWNYANGREADPVTKQRTRDNSYGNSVTMPRDLACPRTPTPRCWRSAIPSGGVCARRQDRPCRHGTAGGQRLPPHEPPDDAAQPDELHGPPLPCGDRADAPDVARSAPCGWWVSAPKRPATDNFEQMDLFTDAARIDKQEKLDRAADALRKKFGGAAM